jgi:hypothetical protein
MSDEKRITIKVLDDFGLYLLPIFFLVMCIGDPDLFDVLQEWCRRYMENKP